MKLDLPFAAFEATSACNLRCRYCYNVWHAPGQRAPPAPDYGQSLRTLKALFRQARVGHLTFTGGEPFLAERLPELVLYARLQGAGVTLITNGSGATRAGYRAMLELGVGLFELPLHAPRPAEHDVLTAVPGAWERSRRSLLELLDLGAAVVAVIVITRLNAALVPETLACVQELGVRRAMLARFNVGGRGIAERTALEPSRAQLQQAFAAADALAASGALAISANVCVPVCVLDGRRYPHLRLSTCSPRIERRPLTITPQGGVRYCNHSPVEIGNLHRQPLAEILRAPYLAAWEAVPAHCVGCRDWERCRGGCRAASEQLGGTLADVDPLVLSQGEP